MLMVAVVTIYIVDVSGFTQAWRNLIADSLHMRRDSLRPLPPFDCGACMSWWACLIYTICQGELSLETIAFSALMSLLSIPIGQAMIFIRESITWLINKVMP